MERWTADKTVKMFVNGTVTNLVRADTALVALPADAPHIEIATHAGEELPCTMHLGRTGETYFLREEGARPAFEQRLGRHHHAADCKQ